MSDRSQHDSGSASPCLKTATTPTTYEDTMSITSSRALPPGPHPTPAHTLAGDVPSFEFMVNKIQGLEVGPEDSKLPGQVVDSKHVESNEAEMGGEYPEASKWDAVAEEDVTRGLQRLSVVAEDEHKEDPSKSVEHYYSLRLAKIISASTVKFDATYLKR